MIEAQAAHLRALEAAKAHGDVRDIHGDSYPIAEGDMLRWEAEQREERRKRAAAMLKRIGPRVAAEKAFA